MGLENLLNHTCDIYHIVQEDKSPGYGLPASPAFSYPDEPDISGQTCHFGVKSRSVTVTQTEPANMMDAKVKLTLPPDTDIRINDLVVDCDTGIQYTAEDPVNIRNHHLFCYIKRIAAQKPI